MLVSFSQINFMTREIGKELLTFTEKDDGERELKDSQSKGLLVVLRRRPRRPVVVEVDVVLRALASLINPIPGAVRDHFSTQIGTAVSA